MRGDYESIYCLFHNYSDNYCHTFSGTDTWLIDLADDIFLDYIIEIELLEIFVQEVELVEEDQITDTSSDLYKTEIGNQVESNAESVTAEEYTEIYQGNWNESEEIGEDAIDIGTMLIEKQSYNSSISSILLSIWIVGAWLCKVGNVEENLTWLGIYGMKIIQSFRLLRVYIVWQTM